MMYVTLPVLGRVEIGPMRMCERAFVAKSWVHGLAEAAGQGRGKPHHGAYLVSMGIHVDRVLAGRDARVMVARDAECSALAYGWLCCDGDAVHWCAVKQAFRRHGVAAALLESAGEPRWYTHRSRHDELAKSHGLQYLPYAERRSA